MTCHRFLLPEQLRQISSPLSILMSTPPIILVPPNLSLSWIMHPVGSLNISFIIGSFPCASLLIVGATPPRHRLPAPGETFHCQASVSLSLLVVHRSSYVIITIQSFSTVVKQNATPPQVQDAGALFQVHRAVGMWPSCMLLHSTTYNSCPSAVIVGHISPPSCTRPLLVLLSG